MFTSRSENMIFDMIATRAAEKLECAKEDIKPESALRELGLDSLDMAELLLDISDAFGIEVEITEDVVTVEELVRKIEEKL